MEMKDEYSARLISNRKLNEESSILTFFCPDIAVAAKPGQFVNISCSNLLKRPFGICSADPESGLFSIGVREVGEGTREIREFLPDRRVDVLGPLGNTFPIDDADRLIIVGGGTGVYPLFFALSQAVKRSIPAISVCGFRCVGDTCMIDEFRNCSDRFLVSTDNGDMGIHGNVLDALSGISDSELNQSTIITVGPEIMMKNVAEWAFDRGLPCFVSLERRMACGIGMCLVCTCKIKKVGSDDQFENKRCCADGPVFDAREVLW
ncbi:MAG: dihydroorotate dehydrogenase electron transfer subunit [Oscillospiraceae bacterium]|nr:dihydroorotate dehydrogenase electron transfer subunit [Oscillospiraceae bacterium]